MAEPTRYVDRRTGAIELEGGSSAAALERLYGRWWGRPLRALLEHPWTHGLLGRYEASAWSRRAVPRFVAAQGIELDDALLTLEEFDSLDSLFTRRLKPGARPIDPDPATLVSPADGRILVYPRVGREGFPIKGGRFTLPEILGDEELARDFSGGALAVVRLAPVDYHRFHFPTSGTPGEARWLDGALESVHPVALGAGARSFAANRRTVTRLRTEAFGELLLVEVGALNVGTIEQTYVPGRPVLRGDEKGTFHMGGSTIILIAGPGRVVWDADLVETSAGDRETLVRVGERIARIP